MTDFAHWELGLALSSSSLHASHTVRFEAPGERVLVRLTLVLTVPWQRGGDGRATLVEGLGGRARVIATLTATLIHAVTVTVTVQL